MTSGKKKVLGFGSALLDVLANVEDDYLKTIGGGGENNGLVGSQDKVCAIHREGLFIIEYNLRYKGV